MPTQTNFNGFPMEGYLAHRNFGYLCTESSEKEFSQPNDGNDSKDKKRSVPPVGDATIIRWGIGLHEDRSGQAELSK